MTHSSMEHVFFNTKKSVGPWRPLLEPLESLKDSTSLFAVRDTGVCLEVAAGGHHSVMVPRTSSPSAFFLPQLWPTTIPSQARFRTQSVCVYVFVCFILLLKLMQNAILYV